MPPSRFPPTRPLRSGLLLLAVLGPAASRADDAKPENFQSWSMVVEAIHDSNFANAPDKTSSHRANDELRADPRFTKGTSFEDSESSGFREAWDLIVGAEADLHLSVTANGLSQAMPEVWGILQRTTSGWSFDLLAQGAYHWWSAGEATNIEPSAMLSAVTPSFWSSSSHWFYVKAHYSFADRLSQAPTTQQRDVYDGVTHRGQLQLEFSCPPPLCVGVLPDGISASYAFEAGDFVSVGPASPGTAAVAKAAAPSVLFDGDQPLGYTAYRLDGMAHELSLEVDFTFRIYAAYTHRIQLAAGGFQATADRLEIGARF